EQVKVKIDVNADGLFVALTGGLAFVILAVVLANAHKFKYKVSSTINVPGNAKKIFESDIVEWSASFTRKAMYLSVASEQLKQDRDLVRQFFEQKGINPQEIVFNAVNINREFSYHSDGQGNSYNTFTGYNLSQNVTVESKDLDKVDNASREISA